MPERTNDARAGTRVGDWLETRGIHGEPTHRGQIIEILGAGEHEHYRVRWDERHESIVYPADGVTVVPAVASPARPG
jgi:hypothetical protein